MILLNVANESHGKKPAPPSTGGNLFFCDALRAYAYCRFVFSMWLLGAVTVKELGLCRRTSSALPTGRVAENAISWAKFPRPAVFPGVGLGNFPGNSRRGPRAGP